MTTTVMTTLCLAILMLATPAATADPTDDDARQRFTSGERLVKDNRFADAYAEFEQGYTASGRPLFLFNMGECARKLGDAVRARDNYERYLREDPAGRFTNVARERLAALPPVVEPTPIPVAVKLAPDVTSAPPISAQLQLDRVTVKTERPLWRRWEVWTGVGVGAFLVGSIAIYALTRGGGGPACDVGCIDLTGIRQ